MQRAVHAGAAALLGLLLLALAGWGAGRAADLGTVRVGTLKFGSVNWQLDVVKRHGLDAREGFSLDVQPFGGTDAADVALMGGGVDTIVEDWLWVSRQRTDGAMLTFIPYSTNVGAVMVRADAGIGAVADLKGREIGVAGGPLDKSWILLRAYLKGKAGFDPARDAQPVYGAPPLLAEKLADGELPATLTFWNYAARLEATGAGRLLEIRAVQEALGVPAATPQVGYVFHEEWAREHPDLLAAFARATRAADAILRDDDAEWRKLRPLTRAESDAVQDSYMRHYREGIISRWGPPEQAAAADLYAALARLGGPEVVGKGAVLAPGTFWPGVSY